MQQALGVSKTPPQKATGEFAPAAKGDIPKICPATERFEQGAGQALAFHENFRLIKVHVAYFQDQHVIKFLHAFVLAAACVAYEFLNHHGIEHPH